MIEGSPAIEFPRRQSPILLTVIHAEEEFDWSAPFARHHTGITHLSELGRLQEIFLRFSVLPTYVIDYPVASQEAGIRAIGTAVRDSGGSLGAHLHPWVNPPYDEAVSSYNSYPGNLLRSLEMAKLKILSGCITENFGMRPTVYLAGRYGFGGHTLSLLQELDYRVDLSSVAMGDFRGDGGPDFSAYGNHCFWEGRPPILRIPHSVADVGFLCRSGRRLFDPGRWPLMRRLHMPGILSRSRAVRRIRLTPEGFSLSDLIVATRTLVAAGMRVLVLSFHSPSIVPGFTPYVRDRSDRAELLVRLGSYLKAFREEFGGRFGVPDDVLAAVHTSSRTGAPGAEHPERTRSPSTAR